MLRIVEELKSSVSEKLEDLVQDESSHLSKLDKVWEQVVKAIILLLIIIIIKVVKPIIIIIIIIIKVVKPIIIKELVNYWQEVARLGRTLEEAAR